MAAYEITLPEECVEHCKGNGMSVDFYIKHWLKQPVIAEQMEKIPASVVRDWLIDRGFDADVIENNFTRENHDNQQLFLWTITQAILDKKDEDLPNPYTITLER